MCFFVFGQTVREERWGGVEGVGCRGMGSGHEKWEWEVGMEMGREG
mgnify:CR=1 FL=1